LKAATRKDLFCGNSGMAGQAGLQRFDYRSHQAAFPPTSLPSGTIFTMTRPFSSNPTSSCKGSSKALRVDSWDVKDDDPDYQEAHDAFLKAHNSAVKTTETGEWNCLQEQRRARQLWGARENRLHLLESSGATVVRRTLV
jgi:hypothetical protein